MKNRTMTFARFTISITLTLASMSTAVTAAEINFNRDVRPILSDKCFVCHGPDAEQRAADLRLDLEDEAKLSAVVPGSPQDSPLIQRIMSHDPDEQMPPSDTRLQLTEEEKTLLESWVEQGAFWNQHWAFVPPQPEPVPDVQDYDWPRTEIDHFVVANLEQHAAQPAPEASKELLLRRVSFDLTGLPPTLEQIDVFLADDSDEAWSKVIDRLLDSHHYGERMASVWLDLARYSDTFGYQVDRDRHVWPWRDWVIRAFNSNMPHDEFVTKQIAGDLLPNATDDDILATTFNRLHPQKVEGGSTPEEFRIEYVSDRTQTFATAFLGLTMECCRCHDHKYDPLTQKEYYQLSAYFDKIDEAGLYSYFTQSTPTPTLMLLDNTARQKIQTIKDRVAAAEQNLAQIDPSDAFEQWLQSGRSDMAVDTAKMLPNQLLHMDFESKPSGGNQQIDGKHGKAIRFSGDDAAGTEVGKFNRSQPFTIGLWMNTPDHKDRAVVWHCTMGWTDAASRGYQLLIQDGRLHASLIHFWPGNAISVATVDPLPVDEWHHVTVRYDGSSRADGLSIFVDGKPATTEVVRDNLFKEITGGKQNLVLGERSRDRGFTNGLADDLQVFDRQLSPIEVAQLADGASLSTALTQPLEQLSQEVRKQLKAYFVSTVHKESREQLMKLTELRNERSKALDEVKEIMVMRETEIPRQTYFLHRGAYDARRDPVEPAPPEILSASGAEQTTNRLELAQWLTSSDHPLTARVAVNHFWQVMFGHGLVRTPEDFGSQGAPPTHPRLLDWLTLDFVEHGWDVKRLLRQIAMSATYRQSSAASANLLAADPDNRLLGRFPSQRLPAEMLRDNALAVSGLLVDRTGGPPAKPYEVEASFKPVTRDKGEGLYRRSVYTYWKRTSPAPVMMVLDAVKRDVCRVSRERTASPLEAFVLMNGPQFVEASRALAGRLIGKHGSVDAALPELFRTLTSRKIKPDELVVLMTLLEEQLTYFREDPERAKKYLSIGDHVTDTAQDPVELAALAAVANALFSYDECLTRR